MNSLNFENMHSLNIELKKLVKGACSISGAVILLGLGTLIGHTANASLEGNENHTLRHIKSKQTFIDDAELGMFMVVVAVTAAVATVYFLPKCRRTPQNEIQVIV